MEFFFAFVVLTQAIDMYQVFEIAGHGVLINAVACGVLYACLAAKLFFKRNARNSLSLKPVTPAIQCFLLLIAAVLVSGIYPLISGNSQVISQYFKTSLHFYFLVLFPFICFIFPVKNSTWTKVIQIWLILSIFINIFGIYQIVARAFDLPFAWLDFNNVSLFRRGALQMYNYKQLSNQFQNFFRATSFFSEPSSLAVFNTFTILFYFVPFVQNRKQFIKSKFLLILIVFFSIIGTFLTFSLTAVMCVAVIIVTVLLIEKKKMFKKIIFASLAGITLIIAADLAVENYSGASVIELFSNRISGIIGGGSKGSRYVAGESFNTRSSFVIEDLTLWQKSPIIGIGIGTHQFHPDAKYTFGGYTETVALSETGLLGFIFLTGMLFFVFRDSWRIKKNIENKADSENVRLEGMTIYIILVLFFVNYFSTNHFVGAQFWHILAVIFSIHKNYSASTENAITAK